MVRPRVRDHGRTRTRTHDRAVPRPAAGTQRTTLQYSSMSSVADGCLQDVATTMATSAATPAHAAAATAALWASADTFRYDTPGRPCERLRGGEALWPRGGAVGGNGGRGGAGGRRFLTLAQYVKLQAKQGGGSGGVKRVRESEAGAPSSGGGSSGAAASGGGGGGGGLGDEGSPRAAGGRGAAVDWRSGLQVLWPPMRAVRAADGGWAVGESLPGKLAALKLLRPL